MTLWTSATPAAPGSTGELALLEETRAGLRKDLEMQRRRTVVERLWAAYDAIPRDSADKRWARLSRRLVRDSLRELDALLARVQAAAPRRSPMVRGRTVGAIGESLGEILRRVPPVLQADQELDDGPALQSKLSWNPLPSTSRPMRKRLWTKFARGSHGCGASCRSCQLGQVPPRLACLQNPNKRAGVPTHAERSRCDITGRTARTTTRSCH